MQTCEARGRGRPRLELQGQTFGRLTAIEFVGSAVGGSRWRCLCACGQEAIALGTALNRGHTTSCGCLRSTFPTIHGHTVGDTSSKEYQAWRNAKLRCFNPRCAEYKRYGARGITMAPEWIHDFPAFLAHIGPAPDPRLSLDRIDNNRGYEPGNVRWATASEQARNRQPHTRARMAGPISGDDTVTTTI